jgi:hypothetical protein
MLCSFRDASGTRDPDHLETFFQALATDADAGSDNPMGIPASVYRANAERADKVLEAPEINVRGGQDSAPRTPAV